MKTDLAYVISGKTGERMSAKNYSQSLLKRKQGGELDFPFIRGPIPIDWLKRAMEVNALAAGLALWYTAGLCSSRDFKLQPTRFRELGISVHRSTRMRQLNRLEAAELIRQRKDGQKTPFIKILTDREQKKS